MKQNQIVKANIYNTLPSWQRQKGVDRDNISACQQGKIHHLLCDEAPQIIVDYISLRSPVFTLIYAHLSGWVVAGLDIKDAKELNMQRVAITRQTQAEGCLLVEGKPVSIGDFARNEGMDEKTLLEKLGKGNPEGTYIVHFTGFRY